MLCPHVVTVRRPSLWRVGELDVLTIVELLNQPWRQTGQRCAVRAELQRQVGQRIEVGIAAQAACDERREQVGELLPLQHCVVVVVDRAQPRQHRGQRRDAAQLPRALDLVDVLDLAGWNTQQAAHVHHAVARVVPVHPVRHTLAATVQLDALANLVALRQTRPDVRVQQRHELRLHQLHLQRHFQPAVESAHALAHEHLAAVEPGTHDQRLLAVKVQHPVGVRLLHPAVPGVDELLLARASGQTLHARGDAHADQVGDPLLGCGLARPVVAHHVAGAVANLLQTGDRLDGAGGGWHPALHAPACTGGVVAVAHLDALLGNGFLARSCHQ